MSAVARRDHIREMLADLKLPGALEAVDDILAEVDRGSVTASEAVERLLNAQITLRNNRRLQTAMRSSRLPAIKTLESPRPSPAVVSTTARSSTLSSPWNRPRWPVSWRDACGS